MTRAEAYSSGWHEGHRWAERDLADGRGTEAEADRIRALAVDSHALSLTEAGDRDAAREMGRARGYRQALADFERGRLAREMFDQAPVNR